LPYKNVLFFNLVHLCVKNEIVVCS
jgi:hypothetical protein